MKMVLLMCEESVAEPVREILSGLSTEGCFLEIPKAHASIASEKRLDTPAFPGTANFFLLPIAEDKIEQLKKKVERYKDSCPFHCCLKLIAFDAEAIL
jgi:hypothetical protein